jgi:hypothetical protein
MRKFICTIITLGKHRFILRNYRYRCRICGTRRAKVLKTQNEIPPVVQTMTFGITEADQIQHP